MQYATGIMVEKGAFEIGPHRQRPRRIVGRPALAVAGHAEVELGIGAAAGGIVELSPAELGLPLDPMPWSFWLVLRLGEAMLTTGALGLGWMLLRFIGVLLGPVAG